MLQYVHHVHYVVEDRDAMVAYLEKTFGMKPSLLRESRNSGKVAHYDIDKTQIQITSPLDPASGIGKYLAAHGPGVYHVAWGVDNVQKAAQEITARGSKLKHYDGKGNISANKDGDFVCSIDPASSLGVIFQLVAGPPRA